jgi:hypothetical protein
MGGSENRCISIPYYCGTFGWTPELLPLHHVGWPIKWGLCTAIFWDFSDTKTFLRIRNTIDLPL